MAEYRLSPAAQRDLDAIFDHGVTRWGPAQAIDYTDRIETACAALATAPLQAPACDHIRPGYRRRSVGRHALYVRQTGYGIAVIHTCTSAWTPSGICSGHRYIGARWNAWT